MAKMTPAFHFSRHNLWLVQLLIKWMPAAKPPADILVENTYIEGAEGQQKIRLRIYKPASNPAPTPVLIWLHGGGFIMGKPEMDDRRNMETVCETGIVIVSVDYRLAPRHPFPAGLEDSYAVLQWVGSHAQQLGVDEERIAVGGVSAGGGLAAALAQLALDRQEIAPIFQLLVYPMLDDRTVLRTEIDDSLNSTWTQKSNCYGWESYLGQHCGSTDVPAYAVPGRRADLSGLPPAWIGVGTLDVFHDEDLDYAQRLQECGIACETQVVPGAFHGFDVVNPRAAVVKTFQNAQITALKKHLFV